MFFADISISIALLENDQDNIYFINFILWHWPPVEVLPQQSSVYFTVTRPFNNLNRKVIFAEIYFKTARNVFKYRFLIQ